MLKRKQHKNNSRQNTKMKPSEIKIKNRCSADLEITVTGIIRPKIK